MSVQESLKKFTEECQWLFNDENHFYKAKTTIIQEWYQHITFSSNVFNPKFEYALEMDYKRKSNTLEMNYDDPETCAGFLYGWNVNGQRVRYWFCFIGISWKVHYCMTQLCFLSPLFTHQCARTNIGFRNNSQRDYIYIWSITKTFISTNFQRKEPRKSTVMKNPSISDLSSRILQTKAKWNNLRPLSRSFQKYEDKLVILR